MPDVGLSGGAGACFVFSTGAPGRTQGLRYKVRHCSLFDSLNTCVGQSAVGDHRPRGAEILGSSPHLSGRLPGKESDWWGLVVGPISVGPV